MNMLNINCPSCGVGIEVEDDVETFACPNCGRSIMIERQHPDAPKTVPVSTSTKSSHKGVLVAIVMLSVAIIALVLGFLLGRSPDLDQNPPATPIAMPFTSGEAKKMRAVDVKKKLTDAGFTNIAYEVVDVKKIFSLGKETGDVKEITIVDGSKKITKFDTKNYYLPNTPIVISYYCIH